MSDVIFDIATIGTSLTAGSGAARSYHYDLEAALQPGKASKIRTYNHGIPGGYSSDGIAAYRLTSNMRAKVILIEFSMNDCLLSEATVEANTITLLDDLKAASPESAIYLMTMNPVVGSSGSATSRSALPDFYQMYRDLSVSQSVGLIDTYPTWSGVTEVEIPNGVHPTVEANRQYLVPAIASVLRPLID